MRKSLKVIDYNAKILEALNNTILTHFSKMYLPNEKYYRSRTKEVTFIKVYILHCIYKCFADIWTLNVLPVELTYLPNLKITRNSHLTQ